MASHVICDKCGAHNRFGTLFCSACGNRMDLKNAKLSRGPGNWTPSNLIHIALFAFIFALLGLLCWPMSPRGDAPSANGSNRVLDQYRAMGNAITRGNEVGEEFAEADINAHLNARLISDKKAEGLHLELSGVRLDIRPGETGLWMGNKLGPLTITYAAHVDMQRGADGTHTFSIRDVKIGRLPMFGPLEDRAASQIARTFSRLREEITMLNRTPKVTVLDGAVELSTIK